MAAAAAAAAAAPQLELLRHLQDRVGEDGRALGGAGASAAPQAPPQPLLPRPPARPCAAAFDAERADLLRRLEACAGPAPSEVYALRAENRKRADEVRDLQKVRAPVHRRPPLPAHNQRPQPPRNRRPHPLT